MVTTKLQKGRRDEDFKAVRHSPFRSEPKGRLSLAHAGEVRRFPRPLYPTADLERLLTRQVPWPCFGDLNDSTKRMRSIPILS